MKDLVDVIPFLQAYEPWVRWLVLVWLLLTAALAGVLLLAQRTTPPPPPSPEVAIDALRVPAMAQPGAFALDLLVRNPLTSAAQLVELRLALYGDAKPAGGLQSYQGESATYVLADGPGADQLLAGTGQGGPSFPVEIGYPYAGQDYVEIVIPLSQRIAKEDTDRFVVRFDTQELPRPSHKRVEAVIRYNGDALTAPRTVTFR